MQDKIHNFQVILMWIKSRVIILGGDIFTQLVNIIQSWGLERQNPYLAIVQELVSCLGDVLQISSLTHNLLLKGLHVRQALLQLWQRLRYCLSLGLNGPFRVGNPVIKLVDVSIVESDVLCRGSELGVAGVGLDDSVVKACLEVIGSVLELEGISILETATVLIYQLSGSVDSLHDRLLSVEDLLVKNL